MARLRREIRQGKDLPIESEVFLNVVRTADALMRGETELLRPHGLSFAQHNVLRILRGAGSEGLRCSEVSERLVARDPDVTRLLDRLERAGLVTRERSERDRRVVTAWITRRGEALLRAVDHPVDEVHRAQLAHLTAADLRALNRLLEKARSGPKER